MERLDKNERKLKNGYVIDLHQTINGENLFASNEIIAYICCYKHVKITIMKDEKITAVLNEVIVNKLESIAFDIKYYINTNAGIAQSLDEESINAFKFMDDEEINELIEIRKRTKQLAYKLKNKLNSK